jgi:hypothetical protein
METLTNLTEKDIKNGALIRMLANAGIPDVREYVKQFHQETEDLIREEFEHPNPNKTDNDEQIVPPADIQRWIANFRPCFDDSSQQLLPEDEEQQQQPLPADIQSWITGLRPRLDDSIQASSREQQQQQEKKPPTDLTSWMQHIASMDLISSTNDNTSKTTVTTNDVTAVSGDLGTWLNDWSKSLAEQPPPTSLDNWLQGLIPKNMHEPIGKATNPKTRLNSYLNAAQEVLSQHGYQVSNEVTPPIGVKTKTGMLGNINHMYFLVSCRSSYI